MANRRTTKERTFEVAVSFDALNAGERFTQEPDNWSDTHVESGYLRDVTEEPTAAEAQGGVAPQAAPERVEEAHGGGQERQG
jgi:hypothetical protein